MLQLSITVQLAHNCCYVEFWIKQVLSSLCLHYGHQLCWCHYLIPGGKLAHLHITVLLQFISCCWSHEETSWCWILSPWTGICQLGLHHATRRGNFCHPHWICLHDEWFRHPNPSERLEGEVLHWLLQRGLEEGDGKICWCQRCSKSILLKPDWSMTFNYTYLIALLLTFHLYIFLYSK